MNSNSNNNPQPTVVKKADHQTKYLQYNYGTKFNNPEEALTIAHAIAYKASLAGYLVSTTASLETHRVEVRIFLGNHSIPRCSQTAKCTTRTLMSHEYWHLSERIVRRMRCVEYRFDIVAS